ncbi:MAG: gliding motility-associated C-terminal domain-containing protein [Cryomorphaceae bacterium]|nr:gliding motility-associated C-terminal domain-containing protein [Cryomorphaceae bacterium]
MNRRLVTFLFFFLCQFSSVGQGLPGSGNCYNVFNTPAYITIPNFGQIAPPFTISTWVRYTPAPLTQCIFSSDNTTVQGYHGFWLNITNSHQIQINTGSAGCYAPFCRRAVLATIPNHLHNQWINITVVVYAIQNADIYINGVARPTSNQGTGGMFMAQTLSPTAQIGAAFEQGVQRIFYNGEIDELSVWNRALPQQEVRENMCKKIDTATAVGLHAYYKFDEAGVNTPLIDYSGNGRNGTHIGGGAKILSGAAVGDESDFVYTPNLGSGVLHVNSYGDSIYADNLTNNTDGYHVYTISQSPNSLQGVTSLMDCLPDRYYGIYNARDIPTVAILDIQAFPAISAIDAARRPLNSSPNWLGLGTTLIGSDGIQFTLGGLQSEFILDIGADTFTTGLPDTINICEFPTDIQINPISPKRGFYVWDDNSSGIVRQVNTPGWYTLNTYLFCGNDTVLNVDSVLVSFGEFLSDTTLAVCEGVGLAFRDTVFQDSGTSVYTILNPNACDSIFTFNISFLPPIPADTLIEICRGDSVHFVNAYFSDEGIFSVLKPDPAGCDTLFDLEIEFTPGFDLDTTIFKCQEDTLFFLGEVFPDSGFYQFVVFDSLNCDLYVDLQVNNYPPILHDTTIFKCIEDTVFFLGQVFPDTGVYNLVIPDSLDCILYLEVTVENLPPIEHDTTIFKCEEDSAFFLGQVFPDTGVYNLVIPDSLDCILYLEVTVENLPPIEHDSTILKCPDDTILFLGQMYSDTGTYALIIHDSLDCTLFLTLHIVEDPYVFRDTLLEICEGETVDFMGVNYNSEGIFDTLIQNPEGCPFYWEIIVSFTGNLEERTEVEELCEGESYIKDGQNFETPGIHNYVIENELGCDTLVTVEIIRLEDEPFEIIAPEMPVCDNEEFNLRVAGGTSGGGFLWNTGERNRYALIDGDGWYWVEHGVFCDPKRDSVFVTTKDCGPKLYIPSAFAPTGTGINEFFHVKGSGLLTYEISIFNRWGQEIFHSTDINDPWDGTFKGKMVPSGIYVYNIVATSPNNIEVIREQGTFMLLR